MATAAPAVEIRETPLQIAQANFTLAARKLGLDADMRMLLGTPYREVCVDLPVRMDAGHLTVFSAYRVQHSDLRGPAYGGVRFHPSIDLACVRALAQTAAWQAAAVNIPFGGAYGGAMCTPANLSGAELERLTRRYVSRIHNLLGPFLDIPAPDVNTTPRIMNWILEEYSRSHGYTPAAVAGKPGVSGRVQATGRGVALMMRKAAQDLGWDLRGLRIAIQGFGNVGSHAALALSKYGCSVVAVSDDRGGIYNETGFDVEGLAAHVSEGKKVSSFTAGEPITNSNLLECPCDVLIPAATESVIHAPIAERLNAKLIVEGASLPTTPAADAMLEARGIRVIPDLLANSGGAIFSHEEWSQALGKKVWDEPRAKAAMESTMLRAYEAIDKRAREGNMSLRTSAYCIGMERVARAERLREM